MTDDVWKLILDTIMNAPPELGGGFYDGRKTAAELLRIYREQGVRICLAYIIGMRRIGKTELFTWLACELYQRHGIKTAWVRNREIEFKKNYESFLNGMRARDLIPPEWIVKPGGVYTDSGKGAPKVIDFVYLNTASNMRGGGHPDTHLMIFDEFQPEDLRYPPHPLQSFMSLTQTILSGKSSMCFQLSNFVSLANPYFVGMEIYPRRQDVSSWPDKGVMIERCRGYRIAIDEDNPWKRIYRTAGYQSYASENEDGLLELVRPPAKGARPADNIFYCIHGRYYRMLQDGKMSFWIREKKQPNPSNCMIYSPYPEDTDRTVHAITKAAYEMQLKPKLQAGCVRFQDPNTLFDLMSPCYYI